MLTKELRKSLENLVDMAWELHDRATTEQEREVYKLEVLDLLSRFPENEERLRIVQ